MKKVNLLFIVLVLLSIVMQSCNNSRTYAEMKEDERNSIQKFIADKKINVISFEDFCANDSMTDVNKNEYVLFKDKGVYMQIVRKGDKATGKRIGNGGHASVITKFSEYLVKGDSLRLSNVAISPDVFTVNNSNGNYYASFNNKALMYVAYGTQSVPSGWLMPLPYIYLSRWTDVPIAKVNLIVPHDVGQSDASSNVYACFYELTYELGRE